jgi:sialate O-acetylesterase
MPGPADNMKITLSDTNDSISLAGQWKYKIDFIIDYATTPSRPNPPAASSSEHTMLYNGMIAPLTPYPIKGIIWYQGESNANDSKFYQTLMPLLIKDWRKQWHQPDVPFFLAQIANFDAGFNSWPRLREAQTMALSVPNTGMAVTIDIGEANNVHPKNKQDVGLRLSLAARAIAYGQDIVYSGPIYDHMTIKKDAIRIHFKHTADGLVAKNGPLKWFEIAGPDKKFFRANAKIDGDTVLVHSDSVTKPVAVRYAWADNPEGCNLYNSANLPASPFRTDHW